MLFPLNLRRRARGIALVESVAAIGLIGLFIAVLIILTSNVLGLLRSSKDNMSASHALQQRIEQLRMENWLQLTSATHLAAEPLAVDVESTSGLANCTEVITVSAYPPRSGFFPIKITRKNGVATVDTANDQMRYEPIVRVDVSLTWRGFPKHRDHTRAATTLIARVGSSK